MSAKTNGRSSHKKVGEASSQTTKKKSAETISVAVTTTKKKSAEVIPVAVTTTKKSAEVIPVALTTTSRQRSNEETSYAAAVTGKGDPTKIMGSWGDGMRNSCSFDAAFPANGSKSSTSTKLTNGEVKANNGNTPTPAPAVTATVSTTTTATATPPVAFVNGIGSANRSVSATAITLKSVGSQAELFPPEVVKVSVGCQTDNATRSQGQMTDSKKQRDHGDMAKLCSCDKASSKPAAPAPVEFHGDHFNLESTLARFVASLGITFVSEIDGKLEV